MATTASTTSIAVIGAGAWGTALAAHLARLDHRVCMWVFEPDAAAEISDRHTNSMYLEGVDLPATLRATSDLAEAARGAEIVLMVPPSSHLRDVAGQLAPFVERSATVVVATKGIEEGSNAFMSQVLAEAMPAVGPERLAFLSGPSFAREVAAGLPADVALASQEMTAAHRVQPLFHSPMLRVYTSGDPIGVQVGGAIKNVIAVAAGACDGLELGNNARAAIITRGLAEMARLGAAVGADPLTFLGMAGVGDLVLTCTGDLSRNRTLGRAVAEGADPQEYLAARRTVAEGFSTAAAAHELATRLSVEMPIAEQVYHVLHRGRPLREAVELLVSRGYRDEFEGIRT